MVTRNTEIIMDMPVQKKRQGTNKLPFASILKRVMGERELSVRAIAEMSGVGASVVQSWLSRANPHDLQAVARLAKALDMSFKELLLGEKDELSAAATAADIFDEKEFFEGICKVSIQRLVPKQKS